MTREGRSSIDDGLAEVTRRLKDVYGQDDLGNKDDPLDELIYIVLSSRTRNTVFEANYARLRHAYPSWSQVLAAPVSELEQLLAGGGLQAKKARWMLCLLATIRSRQGEVSLGFLRQLPTPEAEPYLTSLPGVGVKTARCVLMYALGRPVLPLDAHVFRLMKRLEYIPCDKSYRHSHDLAQALVPESLRHDFHVYAVMHGRRECLPRRPRCHRCVLGDLCPFHQRSDSHLAR